MGRTTSSRTKQVDGQDHLFQSGRLSQVTRPNNALQSPVGGIASKFRPISLSILHCASPANASKRGKDGQTADTLEISHKRQAEDPSCH